MKSSAPLLIFARSRLLPGGDDHGERGPEDQASAVVSRMRIEPRTSRYGVMCASGEFVRFARNWRLSCWMPPKVTVDTEQPHAFPRVVRRDGRVVYVAPGGREVYE